MNRSWRSACRILAIVLLAVGPHVVSAQTSGAPMAALDLQFDANKSGEIARLRQRIASLRRAEAVQLRAKRRNPAALAEVRRNIEQARNALVDLAEDYVAQMETAEALVRLDYGQALADRYRKDLTDTLWRLDKRASAGDARASATLGSLYRLGVVAERNEYKACNYYRRAAQQGHVAALFHASACGEPKSDEALRLRDLAAAGGHPLAQEMRGRECLHEKSSAACALTWLERAAAQGRASAMSLLGWTYATGKLVVRDDKRAFGYFMEAAKLGDAAAQNDIGQMYETGRGVAVSGADAFAWYKRAAEAGLGAAQVNLARSFIEGRGTAPDRTAATFWLEQGKKQGVPEASKLLDWMAAH